MMTVRGVSVLETQCEQQRRKNNLMHVIPDNKYDLETGDEFDLEEWTMKFKESDTVTRREIAEQQRKKVNLWRECLIAEKMCLLSLGFAFVLLTALTWINF